ncbi:MAG: hypothetical protein GZ090_09075 [Oxalobacteraceae bacterium]|nr:hypothetical protein [Oxalobacteraceae bacterium]
MKFNLRIPGTSIVISGHKMGKEIEHKNTEKPNTTGISRFSPIKLTSRPKWATPNTKLTNWAEGVAESKNGTTISAEERKERREVASKIYEFNNDKKATSLELSNFSHITSLPPIPAKTTMLTVADCKALNVAPDVTTCLKMTDLHVSNTAITDPPVLTKNAAMRELDLSNNKNMETAPNLASCPELKGLFLGRCNALEEPPVLTSNKKLQVADFSGCTAMKTGPDFSENTELREASVQGCKAMNNAPILSKSLDGLPPEESKNKMESMNLYGTNFEDAGPEALKNGDLFKPINWGNEKTPSAKTK